MKKVRLWRGHEMGKVRLWREVQIGTDESGDAIYSASLFDENEYLKESIDSAIRTLERDTITYEESIEVAKAVLRQVLKGDRDE